MICKAVLSPDLLAATSAPPPAHDANATTSPERANVPLGLSPCCPYEKIPVRANKKTNTATALRVIETLLGLFDLGAKDYKILAVTGLYRQGEN
jgi:hypothetical protein